MSKYTYFKNKDPISRKKKSFIIFLFCFSFISTSLTYYSIQNSQTSDLPAIYITCEDDIETTDYVDCKIEIANESFFNEKLYIDSKIKIRGRSNSRLPKKGYRLELESKVSLFGMRKDDDWQLFAMYSDMTRMRYKLSFELWRSLLPTNPTTILPDSRFVKLYLNNEYQGLYLLAEKNDRKLFDLDKTEKGINSSLILQAQCLEGHTSLGECDKDCWDEDWPDFTRLKEDVLCDLVDFVNNTSDDEFFDDNIGVYSIFDKDNLIDFFVFNFFILHRDFWIRNYYIIRDTAPNKFYLIPWDFDHSFGQFRTKYYLDADYNEDDIIPDKNRLYDRLMDNDDFMEDCKDRWNELREELWTEKFILNLLNDMYEEIKVELKRDLNMWEPEHDPQKYVDLLFEWIPERLDFCDEYFDQF